MPYVVFQISAATVVHNGHGDDDHDEAMVMKIIRSWLLCCKSHIHRLKQKEKGESFHCCFKGDRDVVSLSACLFVGQAMWYGRDSEGGPLCGEEGERVLHQGFGSTFVVDPGARHGIACHCCSLDSSFFSSSLALEMDPDNSFIFSWVLWSLGCKLTVDFFFSAFKKMTLKSCQGRKVSWPCLTPCHMYFHQGCITWGKRQWS